MIYERIYNKLSKIVNLEELKKKMYIKKTSAGMMDLSFDFLYNETKDSFRIAIAHNYVQNGDLMSDPDMEIRISPASKTAEALTYQQDNLGVYHQVYQEVEKTIYVNPELKKELNGFLDKWLTTILKSNYN